MRWSAARQHTSTAAPHAVPSSGFPTLPQTLVFAAQAAGRSMSRAGRRGQLHRCTVLTGAPPASRPTPRPHHRAHAQPEDRRPGRLSAHRSAGSAAQSAATSALASAAQPRRSTALTGAPPAGRAADPAASAAQTAEKWWLWRSAGAARASSTVPAPPCAATIPRSAPGDRPAGALPSALTGRGARRGSLRGCEAAC
jgi:hypothetical protein